MLLCLKVELWLSFLSDIVTFYIFPKQTLVDACLMKVCGSCMTMLYIHIIYIYIIHPCIETMDLCKVW